MDIHAILIHTEPQVSIIYKRKISERINYNPTYEIPLLLSIETFSISLPGLLH